MYRNDRLYELMNQLDSKDLVFIINYGLGIKDRSYESLSHDKLMDIISSKLRDAASHSFANYFRLEHEFPYKQILIKVIEKLSSDIKDKNHITIYKLSHIHTCTEEEIEKEILNLFELKTKEWWKSLSKGEQEQIAGKITQFIDPQIINSVNRWTLIKYRIKKELIDSIITKGIVVAMLTVSAGGMLGILGGTLLSQIGWGAVVRFVGKSAAVRVLTTGFAGISGIRLLDLIGGLVAGAAVFVPSTIYFYADTNYNKVIPTIVMLLSKVHMKKNFQI